MKREITRPAGHKMAAGLIAAAFVLAACGGDDSDDADDADDGSPVTTTTPDDAATTVGGSEAPATTAGVSAGEWEAIVAAGEDEGKVTIYSSQGVPELGELESRFEEVYDIDLVVVRGLPQDLVPRIEVERQTGRGEADVYVSADQRWVVQADTDGYYVDHAGPAFANPDYDQESGSPSGTYFLSNAVIFGFGWNTNSVPDGLTGYADLLDESLAGGRIGVVEAANETLVDFYVYLEEEMGEAFVADLAAQNPRIYPGSAAINEALASNEIGAAVYTGASLRDTREQGAPVDFDYPPTIFGANFWGGVLESAPNPNAAQVLADFMVTEAGQEALARNGASVLPGVGGTETEIANVRDQDLDLLTPDFVNDYIAEWRSLYQ